MEDIKTSVVMKADFLAVSFPRAAPTLYMAKELMRAAGGRSTLIAKMERAEAIAAMAEILRPATALWWRAAILPWKSAMPQCRRCRKRMIRTARERNKLTITATQMMESMISSPVPTRAEVSDVANAVLDGTDAVMLSAETASGKYPVETVEAMARICLEAEKSAEVTLDANSSIACSPAWTSRSQWRRFLPRIT